MSKEFEAFYILKDTASGLQAYTPSEISNACAIVKSALTELQSIKEAEPSEAMEGVDILYANAMDLTTENIKYLPEYLKPIRDKIKQALLKAQDLEKVLEIIKEHLTFEDSGIEVVKDFLNGKEETKYIIRVISEDTGATIHIHLDTKEEFELLKRWSGK